MALQLLRERSNLSASELSANAGLPSDAVSRIESGEVGLDYLTAARLTQVLGVSLAQIALTAHGLDAASVADHFNHGVARGRHH